MNRDQIKNHDFDGDNLPPDAILDHVSAHDAEMREAQPRMALAKAAYITRWWEWVEGHKAEQSDAPFRLGRIDRIQVNRIKPALSGYLNSLYPRRMKVVCGQDPAGTGEPDLAELVINRWFNSNNVRDRILLCSRQALLYPGAGCKIGYDPGAGSAIDRVWFRSFPYWELVLDYDAHDWDDARFIGHVYYRPRHEVEEEYGLDNLNGSSRTDFLSSSSLGGQEESRSKKHQAGNSDGDESHFVRVLEICNMVDEVVDEEDPSLRYKGRLEIYVLDQGEISNKPIYMGPMAFSHPDGTPMPHILPLIFEHEPEYPYRGLAYAEQLLPQQMELNSYRSYMSQASRKDSRQYVTKKGVLDSETKTMLMDGEEGLVVEVDESYQGALNDVIVPITHGAISNNIRENMSLAEKDLERGMTLSPAALGTVTKATAEEVRAVEAHTESEFGRHAEARDRWLEAAIRVALRAIIAAMQDRGDSDGAYEETEDEAYGPDVGAIPGGEVQAADEDAAEDAAEDAKEDLDFDAGEEEEPEEPEEGEEGEEEEPEEEDPELIEGAAVSAGAADADVRGTVWPLTDNTLGAEQVLELIDKNGDLVTITVEDLDSEFEIGFTETGRSPMSDQDMKDTLIKLADRFFQLMELTVKGGPMGVVAEAYLRTLHDRFELPASLDPEMLMYKIDQAKEEAPPAAPEQPPGGAQAPPGAPVGSAPAEAPGGPPTAPAGGGGADLTAVIQEALSLPPAEGLQIFAKLFENDPEASAIIQEAMSLPPEGQAQAIQMIAEQMMGGQGAPV